MRILKFEKDLELILANNKISFASCLKPSEKEPKIDLEKVIAHANISNPTLFPLESLLVSTCWNINDDVFLPTEVWNARNTPEDTPFNLEHNQNEIIGHITGNWVIDDDLQPIVDENSLPDLFHILTSSVIYKSWEDKTKEAAIATLIKEIKNGEWYVSMECLFNDFDYAVQTPDGGERILARNDDTSFLTKHLRAYGGNGSYDGHKLGRLLRNITFSGKGLVRKPANPNSVIFTKAKDFKPLISSSLDETVYFINNDVQKTISSEKKTMDLEKVNVELKAALDKANETIADLKISASKSRADELTSELEKASNRISQLEAQLTEANTKVSELSNRAEIAEKAKKDMEEEMNKVKCAALAANRISKLVQAGVSKEDAEALVASLVNADDDTFEAFAMVAGAAINVVTPQPNPQLPVSEVPNIKAVVTKMISKNKNRSGAQVNTVTASEALEEVEEAEVTNPTAVASTVDETDKLRSAIATYLS